MQTRNALAGLLGAAGVSLSLLVGGGCRTTPAVKTTPPVTVYRADGGTDISHEILFGSTRVARDVRITDVRRRSTEHGLLNPSVTFMSMDSGTLNVEYRFSWLDDAGYEIGAETNSWKPISLQKGQSTTVESVGPTTAVKEFRLIIRSR